MHTTKQVHKPTQKVLKSTVVRKGEFERGVYIYSRLQDLLEKAEDRINLYAVVLGCSAPYYHPGLCRYLCTMKLVDESLNPELAFKGMPSFMSMTVFSNTKGNIPQPTRVGTVLRIHRGQTKRYKRRYQLNCDADVKAAWAMFDAKEGFTPVQHTGHTYTFIDSDKKRLKDLRKFADKFFKSYDIEEASTIGEDSNEVDMLCLLLARKKKVREDKVVMFNGKEFIKIVMHSGDYEKVGAGDVVYVRAAKERGDRYILNDYSSILKVPAEYKSAIDLLKKVEKAKRDKDVRAKFDEFAPEAVDTPIVGSQPLDPTGIKSVSALKDLFALDLETEPARKFRVKVNVLEIGPRDTASWIQPGEGTNKLPYYKLQLFVKDTVEEDSNIYVLFLCSLDGKGAEFFAGNGRPDAKELKRVYKRMVKPWVALDLVVEGVPVPSSTPVFFIVDTKLTL